MKRILIFSTAYFPHVGGAEVAVRELTDRMSDMHFDMVTIRLSSKDAHFEKVRAVNVYRVGLFRGRTKFGILINKFLFPILGALKAQKLHQKHAYDATWGIMASYGGGASLIFKFIHRSLPFVLTLQEGDSLDDLKKKVRWWMPIFRLMFAKADIIHAISNHLKAFALEMEPRQKVVVIPNGVDVEKFAQNCSEEKINKIKSQFGIHEGEKTAEVADLPRHAYIITTSRLVKKNGVDTLIDAMRFLPTYAQLAIVGNGPDFEILKERAAGISPDRIHFLGFIPFDEIPCYLKCADVFVRLSRSEGFGNSFIEAMASGVPVVATRVGGIVDFVKDPDDVAKDATGLLVKPNDPKSASVAIKKILDNVELRKSLILNGKKTAKEYDWNVIAKKMNDLFLGVCKEKHA